MATNGATNGHKKRTGIKVIIVGAGTCYIWCMNPYLFITVS